MKSTITNELHREKARTRLAGYWGLMAGMLLFTIFANGIISVIIPKSNQAVNLIFSAILGIFLLSILEYGVSYVALLISRDQPVTFNNLFDVFKGKQYTSLLVVSVIQKVVTTVVSGVIMIPAILMGFASLVVPIFLAGTVDVDAARMLFSGSIGLLLFVFILIAILAVLAQFLLGGFFQMMIFLCIDNPQLSIGELLQQTFFLLKGRYGQLLLLQFSFIGWYILGVLPCTLGLLFVTPYYQVSLANFYDATRAELAL